MTYFDPQYFALFLPLVFIGYLIFPSKLRNVGLLIASYIFFWAVSEKLIVYIIASTLLVHYFGLWLDKIQGERKLALNGLTRAEKKPVKAAFDKQQNLVVAFGVIIQIGILAVLKYTPFFTHNINTVLAHFDVQIKEPVFLIPIGISFYTLQAVSYIVDVRRGSIKADKHLLRLALYMSFFPQIMEGPIARYSETADQLYNANKIEFKNLVFGFERIVYGFIKKMIVADRLNGFVTTVFDNYERYDGGIMIIVAIAYTVELYMDFSGAMEVALGTAEIFGIKLPENFRQPFFSKDISEFWTRWHITLGAFFRDYIFYPVSLSGFSKKLTASGRKHLGNYYGPLLAGAVAMFCVWFCNGLWHGSAWMYIFFGMYHFTLIMLGKIFEPLTNKFYEKLHINRDKAPIVALRIFKTSVLVVIGELFFGAHGLRKGLDMFKKIFTEFSFNDIRTGAIAKAGLDHLDIIVVLIVVLFVFIVGILREKGINIREKLAQKNIVFRWFIVLLAIFIILIFGAYGPEYTPVAPMYANF